MPAASLRAHTPAASLPREDPSGGPVGEGELPTCWTITERERDVFEVGLLQPAALSPLSLPPLLTSVGPGGVMWMLLKWAVFVCICSAEVPEESSLPSCSSANIYIALSIGNNVNKQTSDSTTLTLHL